MLTIFFYMTSKPGCEDRTADLVREMTRVTHAEDDGCVTYTFHQERHDRRQWILLEQWRDKDALKAHQQNMLRHFGAAPEGAWLPARLHELIESFRGTYCDVVA